MLRAPTVAVLVVAAAGIAVAGREQPQAHALPAQAVAPAPQLRTLVGFVGSRLVRVDGETLRPLPGPGVAAGSGGCAPRQGGTACWTSPPWAVSPDSKRLALARNDASSVQIVDPARMRVTASLRWGFGGGAVGALAWLSPTRVLAVQETFGGRQRLVAFDLAQKRLSARRVLGGAVVQLARTNRELVLLIAPGERIGTARIAVVDARGTVRFAALERIVAGSAVLGTGSDHRVDLRSPALAVDPQGRRALVVAQELAAEVDLRTLAVSYRSLERPRSLLGRLWSWLEPVASAKQVSGYQRHAAWLGNGLLAFTGSDTEDGRYRPSGLQLLDTRGWTLRDVDRDVAGFRLAEGLLLATGGRWDESLQRNVDTGLVAYTADGTKRFHLFAGESAWLAQVYAGRAYVGVASQHDRLRIVDLASGAVTGSRDSHLPSLLLGPGSGWWG